MINILIADDQVLLRDSIKFILENDEDIKVVGTASDGEEVIEQCRKTDVDIVLMDIEMPKLDGVEATRILKEEFPNIKVLILTTFENKDNIIQSLAYGAEGYVVKDINHDDLISTIKCINAGLYVMHKSVKKIIFDNIKKNGIRSSVQDLLTQEEIDIIKFIAMGKSNKYIAEKLSYSEGTIKNKVSKIFDKLNLTDRVHLAIWAIENSIA